MCRGDSATIASLLDTAFSHPPTTPAATIHPANLVLHPAGVGGAHLGPAAFNCWPPSAMQVGPDDEQYDEYPELSIEEWHRKNNLYIE